MCFWLFDWQLRDCPTGLKDKKNPNFKETSKSSRVSLRPLLLPLPSTPPPRPSDPPCVFLKDDSLFANTWALNVGTWPREGEKQTQQVSAFLSMKNKQRERDEREGWRRIWRDAQTHRGEDEGVFSLLRFIPARSPTETRACFVALRHRTGTTSSEVAVCWEPVGGGGGGGRLERGRRLSSV